MLWQKGANGLEVIGGQLCSVLVAMGFGQSRESGEVGEEEGGVGCLGDLGLSAAGDWPPLRSEDHKGSVIGLAGSEGHLPRWLQNQSLPACSDELRFGSVTSTPKREAHHVRQGEAMEHDSTAEGVFSTDPEDERDESGPLDGALPYRRTH